LLRLERGDVNGANQLLDATIFLANLAPLLTLLTLAAILAIIVYFLYKRSSKPRLEPPLLPSVFKKPLRNIFLSSSNEDASSGKNLREHYIRITT